MPVVCANPQRQVVSRRGPYKMSEKGLGVFYDRKVSIYLFTILMEGYFFKAGMEQKRYKDMILSFICI